jgi:hypothetical protein
MTAIGHHRDREPGTLRVGRLKRVLREWDPDTLTSRTLGCATDEGSDRRAWRKTDWRWQDDTVAVTEEGRRQAVCDDSSHAERSRGAMKVNREERTKQGLRSAET